MHCAGQQDLGVSKKPKLASELSEHEQKIASELVGLRAARDGAEPKTAQHVQLDWLITRLKGGCNRKLLSKRECCDSPKAKLQRPTNRANKSIVVTIAWNSNPSMTPLDSTGPTSSFRASYLQSPRATSHLQVVGLSD